MRHIKPYQVFEASATAAAALTEEQIKWLDKCAKGIPGNWKLNPQTGFVDVYGRFECNGQGLRDLKGVKFGEVSGDFWCNHNQLTSLEGAPQTIGGGFGCDWNQLTSLVGAPQSVGGGGFSCSNNQLTSLEGAPHSVGGFFYCNNNQLASLVGAPKTVGRDFLCRGNPVTESTLRSIFALMENGYSYQQALEEHWPEMGDEDRALMCKQMTNLSPEDERKYKALATYSNIKNYL